MTLLKVEISREKLRTLPEAERKLFLGLAHMANEINGLTKLLYWAANSEAPSPAQGHGNLALMLLLSRLLAGKLNEGWQLLQDDFFGSALSRTYEPEIGEVATEALDHLKRYFSARNSVHQIRNRLSFHYSTQELDDALEVVDDPLYAYLDDHAAPNNLFHFSDVLVTIALSAIMDEYSGTPDVNCLPGELFTLAGSFAEFADGLMDAILRFSGEEWRAAEPEELHLDELPSFEALSLPWFTDLEGLVPPNQGSA